MLDLNAIGIHQLYTFLLIFGRIGGVFVSAPFVSNRAIPAPVRAGFAAVLSMGITPLIEKQTGPIPDSLPLLAGQVSTDILFGMALGYFAKLLFSAIEMAGYFVDTQMGFGFVNLVNPFSEQQESIMSVFQYQLALTLYILMNGHLLLLGALVKSFSVLPPGAVSPQANFGLTVIPMLQLMFSLGFRLALPAVGVLLTMDVAFGLVARMVPQINIFMVGIPAKVIVGLATVALLLPTISLIVGELITGTMTGLSGLIAGSR